MTDRRFVLKTKITHLMDFLQAIRSGGLVSLVVQIENGESRTYNVLGIHDALSTLANEIASSDEIGIAPLEEIFEHDREDVLRIVGKLAQMAASTPG